ncbi:carbohydrate ABC transporter permease [Mesorhizobium sp. B2-5-13]|uniref:carbohydrate ABC transporter permease n=1 Tax=unclassified Mesorhizobium TaxID=325217 RepID=UPI00112EA0C5|nr:MULTISPECIES: carbohydrate ABC transporter permease [unclassified Mesorhizobium]TPJ88172.1 carbohydrate ABC transporter permease [Mesorhizobium sp. B2-5-13]TPK52367.1 carbohydrate ABC transporter permease [Mesorhizobium sp. B2-5-5]
MSAHALQTGQDGNIAQVVRRGLTYALLIALSAFFLMPVYMLFVNGLKSARDVSVSDMWSLPRTIGLGGFAEAWEKLGPSFQNSLIMTGTATIVSCLIGSLTAYILTLWGVRFSRWISVLIIFGMFIPYQSIIIPLTFLAQKLGLYGTLTGLIIVHVIYGQSVNILVFGNYYRTIPKALIEAAKVDGAGILKTYFKIIVPLSAPGFVVAGIFQFTNIWNDFLFGVILVPNPAAQPVTVALSNLSGNYSVDWNVVMAGAIVAALPTILIYLVLGRYFVQGLTSGSVKS